MLMVPGTDGRMLVRSRWDRFSVRDGIGSISILLHDIIVRAVGGI